jgi:hypothetical protein
MRLSAGVERLGFMVKARGLGFRVECLGLRV